MALESFSATVQPEYWREALKKTVDQAMSAGAQKYNPYLKSTIAPFTPDQLAAYGLVRRYAAPPDIYGLPYEQEYGGLPEELGGEPQGYQPVQGRPDIITKSGHVPTGNAHMPQQMPARQPSVYGQFPTAGGLISQATQSDNIPDLAYRGALGVQPEDIARFYNPYEQRVVEDIGKLAGRNLHENLLPNINTRFIGAGQYGSTAHQDFTNRAVRDTQEAALREQARAMQHGYGQAMEMAAKMPEEQFRAAQVLGREKERQLLGAENLVNTARAAQIARMTGAQALGQSGATQQNQLQRMRSEDMRKYAEEQNFPYKQAEFQGAILRGLQPPTSMYGSAILQNPPPQPQASPWTQGAGLLAGFSGMAGMGGGYGYSHGGHVKKHRHYAEGGHLSPIQSGSNAAIDSAEMQSMRQQAQNLGQRSINPMQAAIARGGFNLAANPRAGFLSKLGEAGGQALSEYQNVMAGQDKRQLQSAKIYDMIQKTREIQAGRAQKGEIARQNLAQTHAYHMANIGLGKERLAMEREMYERGLKGNKNKGVVGKDIYAKSNAAAMEETRKSVAGLPALQLRLENLKELAKKLKTGSIRGRAAALGSTAGEWAGIGSAEDIDTFNNDANSVILDIEKQLGGSKQAVARLNTLKQSKMSLTNDQEANIKNIDDLIYLGKLTKEKGKFVEKALESGRNALEIENAFNDYSDAKLKFEKNKKDEGTFEKKPEEFLEDLDLSENTGMSPNKPKEKNVSEMSEEELKEIVGKK